jgi:hypothetical protein
MWASMKQGIIEAISLRSCTTIGDRGVTAEKPEHDVPSCVPLHPRGHSITEKKKTPVTASSSLLQRYCVRLDRGSTSYHSRIPHIVITRGIIKMGQLDHYRSRPAWAEQPAPPWLRSASLRLRMRRRMLRIPSVRLTLPWP